MALPAMAKSELPPSIERALEEIRVELVGERPDLAHRLDRVVQQVRDDPTEPAGYVSTGEAA